ncbi:MULTISPECIES: DEAD/DEAH box helicase [unclassified Deinococcus]|uniref:DEAD/DEAH box helicase n=1 Tax=unclassified Deinococcus TaxID=2623546 RepID=UPI001C30890A|nr:MULTISPECIES: DEAD/DEAH box helicase family protein [unclassified Deinococcus]MDK2014635.1 DEAD/DEAH box helicase family protein [Deinococcus sp. 43]
MTSPERAADIVLPAQYAAQFKLHGSLIEQLQHLQVSVPASLTPLTGKVGWRAEFGGELIEVYDRKRLVPAGVTAALQTTTGDFPSHPEEIASLNARWLAPHPKAAVTPADAAGVRHSWQGAFHFLEEQLRPDKTVQSPGLRPPQIGAVYAALSHWTAREDPATIVMPTGTGKTETMLALCVQQRMERLLVVVPNDALRDQIGEKFVTLGLLKAFGVVGAEALYPIVCRLKHIPKNLEQVEQLFGSCNVVVTTMSILSGCTDEVLSRVVEVCSHLFVDEAHHVPAATWDRVKSAFPTRRILQFTATPFREDRKHIGGSVIFTYPLHKAQEEGYFKPITFKGVWSHDPAQADELIARAAVDALTADLTPEPDEQRAPYDHLVMARADSIAVAQELHALYQRLAPQYAPVLVHSQLPKDEQRAALAQLRSRTSRIVVCVNMFGEGFDFPELKIAALHELHRSLAVTLQFTGRFTRSKPNLGDATVIANLAEPQVRRALNDLYAENADWNVLLRDLSTGAVGRHQQFSAFLQAFTTQPKRFSLSNLTPKMSTVVFQTGQDPRDCWNPLAVTRVLDHLLEAPVVNPVQRVVVAITQNTERIDWGMIQDLTEVTWDLHVVHWHEELKLLFVHSTGSERTPHALAAAVSGTVTLIRGEQTFRVLSGIQRLMLTNLGLKDTLGRAKRFSFHVGTDVLDALSEAQIRRNKSKSNLFGHGFRNGDRASAGASSRKGKIWAYLVAENLEHWLRWCDSIGHLLLDASVNIDDIVRTAVKPEPLTRRPNAVPLAMDWSADVIANAQDTVRFDINGSRFTLYEVDLRVLTHDQTSPIEFAVEAAGTSATFTIALQNDQVVYQPTRGILDVMLGNRTLTLDEWFQTAPPVMHFSDRYLVEDHLLVQLSDPEQPYPRERIEAWDWTGTDLQRESQGSRRDPGTIQYRVMDELKRDPERFTVLFDDDDQGEAADVVAFRWTAQTLEVHFYHCKYAKAAEPGHRVADLYEVCGQTQKSVQWRDVKLEKLVQHLVRRESQRTARGLPSRFEPGFGNLRTLTMLEKAASTLDVRFHLSIVQPGLSRAEATAAQLDLLAATEMYLAETYQIPLRVIGSD